MKLTHSITRYLKTAALCAPLLAALSACQEDGLPGFDEVPRQDNLPVEFIMSIDGGTRGPNYFKTEFDPTEVVHVQGTFHLSDGSTVVKYGAMRFDGEKWSQYNGATGTGEVTRFTWPNNADWADFKAYYIHGSNSLMVPISDPDTQVTPTTLSQIVGTSPSLPDRDPLEATLENVRYGHTIPLKFTHACTYLTVEELPAGVSNLFWFTREDSNGDAADDFYNAFRLYLTEEKELKFEFVQVPDANYDGKVYVQGTTKTYFDGSFEKASAGFFLAPGNYLDFVVGYPGSTSMINYISYAKEEPTGNPGAGSGGGITGGDGQEGDDGTQKPDLNPDNYLAANGVYTFNVAKSTGVKIDHQLTPDEWDEGDDPIYDVDAEQFLWAICNSENYYVEDGVQIIKADGTVATLLHNVNMNHQEYTIFAPSDYNKQTWFEPSLGQGVTFDGGGHYIWNLGSPLFVTIDGTVKHLGLSNAKINVVTRDEYTPGLNDEPDDPDNPDTTKPVAPKSYDMSRQGAICGYLNNGTVENIRIKTATAVKDQEQKVYKPIFEMNAKVDSDNSQESHNIGCLFGSNNNGTINNVTILCDMTLNISNYSDLTHVPRVYIGGIIGQNVNQIHNISTGTGTNKITIKNECYYSGASYSIGGVVGLFSGGMINNVTIPGVSIDSRKSTGFTSYIGGCAGRLSNADSGGNLLNVSVAGSVWSGKCGPSEGNAGQVYTGGLSGSVDESFAVQGCYTGVNVYGPYDDNYVAEGVTYGTGGMFGRISKLPADTPAKILNDIATGKTVRGPSQYIGSFAGIAPAGETWEDNYQGNDLLVPTITVDGTEMPQIGGNL